MRVLILIGLCILVMGCTSEYTQEDLDRLIDECKVDGGFTSSYFESSSDEYCIYFNYSGYDEPQCFISETNISVWTEAITCSNFDTRKFDLYGNCSYAMNHWIEERNYIYLKVFKCHDGIVQQEDLT